MRTPRATWIACAAALAVAADGLAQRPPQRLPLRPTEFAVSQDDNLFSLPRSQEDIHQWETALQELDEGKLEQAVDRLHRLLENETGGVASVGAGRYVGLRLALIRTLAELPPAAKEAYERLVRREAGALAEQPLHTVDADRLELLARRFPAAELGRRARVRLGDLALEAGDGRAAAGHFLTALDAATIGSNEETQLTARLAAARVLADSRTARADAAADALSPPALAALQAVPASTDRIGHPALGGGGDGRTPMAEAAGEPRRVVEEDVAAAGFDRRESGFFAMHAVGDLDGIYINTGREVVAFDPLRRSVAWVSDAPLRDAATTGWEARQYEDQVNADMVLAASCGDDVVVAHLQVPEKGANVDFQGGFRILSKIPQRRLYAWSRSTGKQLWAHFDEVDGQRTRRFAGHDACGPPLVVGDTVYAPVIDRSGAIQFAVGAYDLQTGQCKWRRLVCSSQQDVNMFGNARSEFAASPLAVHEGVIYGSSNLGVVYALEMATGRVRWITSYPVVQMPRTMFHGQRDRVVYFANNPPVVADRVVCLTPLDAQFVLGIDADRGDVLWRMPAEADVDGEEHHARWLVGTFDDEFLMHGYGCVAIKARPNGAFGERAQVRSVVPPIALSERGEGRVKPRSAVTADHIWFARPSGIRGFDRAGNPAKLQIPVDRFDPGNLVFVDGAIVSLRQRAFDIFLDAAALQQRVEARLEATPDDPAAILRAASLRSAMLPREASAAAVAAVAELYRAGLAAAERRGMPPSHPVRLALQRELFARSLSRADAAILAGSPEAPTLLAVARDAAPDDRTWVAVQARLLLAAAGDRPLVRAELDRLERRAPEATIAYGDEAPMPVAAFLLWRRARLAESPSAAVELWQQLLERHGGLPIEGARAAELAQRNIAEAIRSHGPAVYAAIAARADAALAEAGTEATALAAVSERFPNSPAAGAARTRLLDLSVAAGDLALAIGVLAQELQLGEASPGLLRRVAVAAAAKGNRALAVEMLGRLRAFAGTTSDWPADGGASYGAVVERLLPTLAETAPAIAIGLPEREVARIRPRSTRESLRLLQVVEADGFARAEQVPLYAIGSSELMAFDVHARDLNKPILFRQPSQFLEHAVLCGSVLVVPDLERVYGIDYRSGAVVWDLPNPQRRIYDSLGVQRGVLHLSAQSTERDGGAELQGVDPLTGTLLFARPLPAERMRPIPKSVDGRLLAIAIEADGSGAIERIDPVTGRTIGTLRLPNGSLSLRADQRAESLLTRMFVQGLHADAQRVYVKIEGMASGAPPRVVAFGADGKQAWTWTGEPGRRLEMVAHRDGRVVIVTGSEDLPGAVVLLAAADGRVLQETPLGVDVTVLNWQQSWLDNPAPATLCLADRSGPRGQERRFLCVGIADGRTGFLVPLGAEDGELERQPLFGDDFVTFGVRPAQRGPFRLYSLRLTDRSGALSAGRKSQHLQLGPTFGLAAQGAYTVISGADSLLVLGPADANR